MSMIGPIEQVDTAAVEQDMRDKGICFECGGEGQVLTLDDVSTSCAKCSGTGTIKGQEEQA